MRRTTSTAASQVTALEQGKVAYNAGNLTVAVTLLKEVSRIAATLIALFVVLVFLFSSSSNTISSRLSEDAVRILP